MRSVTRPAFWRCYRALTVDVRQEARKAYRLWLSDPSQPTLHFKPMSGKSKLWSVRVNNRGYRAMGIRDGDLMTWIFIGTHDDYLRSIANQ